MSNMVLKYFYSQIDRTIPTLQGQQRYKFVNSLLLAVESERSKMAL